MSSSSLTALSSTSLTTTQTSPSVPAPRAIRTYGKPKVQESPAEGQKIPSAPTSPAQPSPVINHSPAKALLNRWEGTSRSWLDSVGRIDASSSQGQDEKDDMDAVKKEMERMRREARGEPSAEITEEELRSSERSAQQNIPKITPNLAVPAARLAASYTSSSLSDLPTSSLPSSPPRKAVGVSKLPVLAQHLSTSETSELEEETFPIRKLGSRPTGKARRVVESDDEGEEDSETTEKDQGTPTPQRIATTSARSTASPLPMASLSPGSQAGHHTSSPKTRDFDLFVSTLADADGSKESDEEGPTNDMTRSTPNADPVSLFEEDGEGLTVKKQNRIKPLNKKDQEEMRKDMARAKRDRPVAVSKTQAKSRPMSEWVEVAAKTIAGTRGKAEHALPSLVISGSSQPSSPLHPTPDDEIKSFSPSSAGNAHRSLLGGSSKVSFGHAPSSPTPQPAQKEKSAHTVVPATSEEAEDDDHLVDFGEMMRKDREREIAAQVWAEKKKALVAAMSLKPPLHRESPSVYSDDELEFVESPVKPKKTVRIALDAQKVDGHTAVHKLPHALPISKQKQRILKLANRSARPREVSDLTETYVDIAGKTFKHATAKILNGGSVPVGQKKGRDEVIPKQKMDELAFLAHQRQAAALTRSKEEAWGRTRVLPERQTLDGEGLVELAKSIGVRGVMDDDEEDDEEDDDFVPEGEEGVEQDGSLQYSGEESGGDDESATDAERSVKGEAEGPGDEDKENQTPVMTNADNAEEEEDDAPIRRRKNRTKARVAFDSDDEEIISQARPPTSVRSATPVRLTQPLQTTTSDAAMEIELDGFGGSPGFSQLFDETQAHTDEGDDGLAGLRDQAAAGLLPAHLLLPDVKISKTQALRDNALIAVEVGEVSQCEASSLPKQRYLNDQGFLTQTKPIAPSATLMSDDESQLFPQPLERSESSVSLAGFGESLTETSSRTPEAHSEEGDVVHEETKMLSPTQGEISLTRLKRRTTPPPQDPSVLANESPDPSVLPNAFQYVMAAAARQSKPKTTRVKSNFVEEQAEESDEDFGWGPTGGQKEDEDGEEGDDEGYLEDLVDDQEVAEEERRRQDELALEKAREDQRLDDQKREEEAKKITAGEARVKRRGVDFFSGDEDEEGKPRLSKKQRRQRRLGKKDELMQLEGEERVFLEVYENGVESDLSDIEDDSGDQDEEEEVSGGSISADRGDQPLEKDTLLLLRERARKNRDLDPEAQAKMLDRQLGFGTALGDWEIEMEDESQFSISKGRNKTVSTVVHEDEDSVGSHTIRRQGSMRSTDSLQQYITEESQTNRRAGGSTGGISVVNNKSMLVPISAKGNGYMGGGRNRQNFATKSASTSILIQKTAKFAS